MFVIAILHRSDDDTRQPHNIAAARLISSDIGRGSGCDRGGDGEDDDDDDDDGDDAEGGGGDRGDDEAFAGNMLRMPMTTAAGMTAMTAVTRGRVMAKAPMMVGVRRCATTMKRRLGSE